MALLTGYSIWRKHHPKYLPKPWNTGTMFLLQTAIKIVQIWMPVFRRFEIFKKPTFSYHQTLIHLHLNCYQQHTNLTHNRIVCVPFSALAQAAAALPAGHSVTGTVCPLSLPPQICSQSRAMQHSVHHHSAAVLMWMAEQLYHSNWEQMLLQPKITISQAWMRQNHETWIQPLLWLLRALRLSLGIQRWES